MISQRRETLVVVGNGMAGARVVEEILARAPGRFSITMFGAEPHGNYNRILLSPVLAAEKTIADIMLNPRDWYEERGITLHAFQGWADKFLNTPAAGIDDKYVKFAYPFGKHGAFTSVSALAWYHDFTADRGSTHFGDELDFQVVARTKKIALTLKYASYDADLLLTDTDKIWLSVDYAL